MQTVSTLSPDYQMRVGMLSDQSRKLLLRDISRMHSFSVHRVIDKIDQMCFLLEEEKEDILAQLQRLEELKEEAIQEGAEKN